LLCSSQAAARIGGWPVIYPMRTGSAMRQASGLTISMIAQYFKIVLEYSYNWTIIVGEA
jgi:hypothetical protein